MPANLGGHHRSEKTSTLGLKDRLFFRFGGALLGCRQDLFSLGWCPSRIRSFLQTWEGPSEAKNGLACSPGGHHRSEKTSTLGLKGRLFFRFGCALLGCRQDRFSLRWCPPRFAGNTVFRFPGALPGLHARLFFFSVFALLGCRQDRFRFGFCPPRLAI